MNINDIQSINSSLQFVKFEESTDSLDTKDSECESSPKLESNDFSEIAENEQANHLFDESLDKLLLEEAERYVKHWKRISKKIKNTTNKFFPPVVLRKRYEELVSEKKSCKKGLRFSAEEDTLLLELGEKMNKNWQKISDFFPMRDLMSLKNRFFKLKREEKESKKSSVAAVCKDEIKEPVLPANSMVIPSENSKQSPVSMLQVKQFVLPVKALEQNLLLALNASYLNSIRNNLILQSLGMYRPMQGRPSHLNQ